MTLPSERCFRRDDHGNYSTVFAAPSVVVLSGALFFSSPWCQVERCRCSKVSPRRVNTAHISTEKRVAFSGVFFSASLALSLSRSLCRPAVNFLSCPVSDPEHSLPHSNLRHHPRRLRPPVPPLDGPVPHRAAAAAMMGTES